MKKWLLATLIAAPLSVQADVVVREFEAKAVRELVLHNFAGDTVIKALGTGPVVVRADKKRFEESCQLTIELKDGKLEALVDGKGTCETDFTVTIPANTPVSVASGAGPIRIQGLTAAVDVKSGSGLIDVDGASDVSIKAGTGQIRARGLKGPAEIKNGTGDIELAFAQAPRSGGIDIRTGSGNAEVSFPKGTLVNPVLKAGMGQLRSEIEENMKTGVPVTMKAGIGNLTIKSR